MSEESSREEISAAGSRNTPAATKRLSEDALGLGPRHVGPFVIGVVDTIVGEAAWKFQDSWPRKMKSSNWFGPASLHVLEKPARAVSGIEVV